MNEVLFKKKNLSASTFNYVFYAPLTYRKKRKTEQMFTNNPSCDFWGKIMNITILPSNLFTQFYMKSIGIFLN